MSPASGVLPQCFFSSTFSFEWCILIIIKLSFRWRIASNLNTDFVKIPLLRLLLQLTYSFLSMNEEKGRHPLCILHLCVYNAWLLSPILGNIQLSAFWPTQCNFKMLIIGQYFRITRFHLKFEFQPLFGNRKWVMSVYPHGNKESQMATAFQRGPGGHGRHHGACCEKTQASLGTVTGGAPSPSSSHGRKEALRQLKLSCQNTASLQGPKGNQPPKSINHQNQKRKRKKWTFEASDLG